VGLLQHSEGSLDEGYVLFAPMNDSTTYLIDKCGYVVHRWAGKYRPGLSVYLLPNGKLLKSGRDLQSTFANAGGGGYIEIQNWDGSVEWRFKLSTQTECQHHDIKILPNGNILAIVWDKKSKDEAKLAGRDSNKVSSWFWSEKIQELRPIGKDSAEIVWEWCLWDHLVQDYDENRENFGSVQSHPELIDINFGYDKDFIDWQHMNSVDYNSEFDQILLSSRSFNEIWIIDHSTTSAQAATDSGGKYGRGGDILYRWGNQQAYKYGTNNEQKLFFQHNAHWIEEGYPNAGSIMVFNNLNGSNGVKYSSVDIIKTPVNEDGSYNSELPFAPTSNAKSYTTINPADFYAYNLSGAQMLKNGSVLICNGASGLFFEMDSTRNTVWKYMNPVGMNGIVAQGKDPKLSNNVFRCTFYPADFSAFEGKDLSQKGIIESINENSNDCTLFNNVNDTKADITTNIYPNPSCDVITIECTDYKFEVKVYDFQGRLLISGEDMTSFITNDLSNGIYLMSIIYHNGQCITKQFIVYR